MDDTRSKNTEKTPILSEDFISQCEYQVAEKTCHNTSFDSTMNQDITNDCFHSTPLIVHSHRELNSTYNVELFQMRSQYSNFMIAVYFLLRLYTFYQLMSSLKLPEHNLNLFIYLWNCYRNYNRAAIEEANSCKISFNLII